MKKHNEKDYLSKEKGGTKTQVHNKFSLCYCSHFKKEMVYAP